VIGGVCCRFPFKRFDWRIAGSGDRDSLGP
jgi:hypothetical protein